MAAEQVEQQPLYPVRRDANVGRQAFWRPLYARYPARSRRSADGRYPPRLGGAPGPRRVFAQPAPFCDIPGQVPSGRVEALCETLITLEGVKNADRSAVFGSTTVDTTYRHGTAPDGNGVTYIDKRVEQPALDSGAKRNTLRRSGFERPFQARQSRLGMAS
jgi:hypothetical protein